jgi:hypothetical protein
MSGEAQIYDHSIGSRIWARNGTLRAKKMAAATLACAMLLTLFEKCRQECPARWPNES